MSEYPTKTTRKKTSLAERFAKHLSPPNENGCVLWSGAKSSKGYGIIISGRPDSRRLIAHRVAYELAFGPFDQSLLVCHRCDVPLCCAASHLFLGTQADNMADMVVKGRSATGERHASHRLTEESVRQIRSRCDEGCAALSIEFGVSYVAIWNIINRKTWKLA